MLTTADKARIRVDMNTVDHIHGYKIGVRQMNTTTQSAETRAVEWHNTYGWIRPDADACEICGRKAYATPVDGFVVRECTQCERLICEEHADADADCDQDGYFLTSWVCSGGCK